MSDINAPATVVAPAVTAPAGKLTDSVMGEPTSVAAGENTPETPAVEAPATEPVKTEAEQRFASKFAAFTRKEKELKSQERRMAQERKELEAQKAAMTAQGVDPTKYISVEEFNKNPYKFIKEHKHSLESVAEIALNDGKVTPETLAAQLKAELKAEIDGLKKQLQDKDESTQAEKIAQAENNFKGQLTKFVTETPDYEMIQAYGDEGVQLVYDVIDTYYNEQLAAFAEENDRPATHEERNGFILSNKQASDMVEQHLFGQEKARIEKARKMTKTKGLFEPAAKPVEQKKVSASATNTLTNTLSAQVPSKDSKTLNDEESKREAAKLIKFVD